MSLKIDLHIHTIHSKDSVISPSDLVRFAKAQALDGVAITDHNQTSGAWKIMKETDFLIIPGTEVSSQHGHIVGLNVNSPIPKGLTADETVERIHEQGGLAIACHPFALFKGSIGSHVNKKFDAIEAINASAFPFKRATMKAKRLAQELKLPMVAGTDAHYGPVIGRAYAVINSEPTIDDVLKAIKSGKCRAEGRSISVGMRIQNQGRFLKKYFKQ